MVAALIRTVVATAVALFYRLERRGPAVPEGPALLAANHPNSLLDPIVVFATAGRAPRPLAKAPLFDRTVVGRLIRWVGGIPVYRREDDPGAMGRNEDTFRAVIAALHEGAAIQIFPEGRSHSDPELSPLRTGTARIALAAEAAADGGLGLALVPVGLTYDRKPFFRGRAVAVYGAPLELAPWLRRYADDPHAAARGLTDDLDRALRALTLNLTESEDAALIDAAERMWALEHGLATPRQRVPLADRLPRLQAFARGLAWLRAHDPAAHVRLRHRVERYVRRARLLGVAEGDVPDRYPVGASVRWLVTVLLPTVLLAPLALAAAVAWYVPYRMVGLAVDRMTLKEDVVATYKLAGSLVAYPLFLALWVALAWWGLGAGAAAAAVVVLPLLGVVGIAWLDRARIAGEDLRLFRRVARRADRRERLARERAALVAEFEALAAAMEAGAETPSHDAWTPAGS